MISKPMLMQQVFNLGSQGLGLILAFSSITHLFQPFQFYESIVSYQLLSMPVAALAAIGLPALQLSLATALLWIPPWRGVGLFITSILLLLFFAAQLSAYLRGLEIDCGCFGHMSHRIDIWSLHLVGFLGLFAMIASRSSTGAVLCNSHALMPHAASEAIRN